ncbi:NLI interacting factor-like phosphatase family protein, putative [Babesia bigemina]|uniref:Mitochondrial import inner membrane translocase subunit TIM50 n=1 Tax=Babesia bigemina TaxID=5866 RepID=A0A061DBP1_BABBI|nr:NLI interacting factor-like phosphatase family protein, putative [Babesia bigemina]CDR95165.1 NLI interacting factor-like phosphatase family protein, putative [Babesia bigemina]|eukprot:XP_012767351.1 NLI interacting factor-like phosphatase family protein, putative [Babesia bigemina]
MGLFEYLSSALSVAVELNYYVLGAGALYLLAKIVEFKAISRFGSGDELFAKRVRPGYSLVLDLDGTILHSVQTRGNNTTSSIALNVGKRVRHFVVYKRPHLDTFLMEMRKRYEIVLYSASQPLYADACLNYACVNHLFDRKLYRNDCIVGHGGAFVKDLCKINSDLSKVVVLQNPLQSNAHISANSLFIDSWSGGRHDTALLDIMPLLQALSHVDDVRHILALRRSGQPEFSQRSVTPQEKLSDSAATPGEPFSAAGRAEILGELQNWDNIGARLTTRVKRIFDTMGPDTTLHMPAPRDGPPRFNKNNK